MAKATKAFTIVFLFTFLFTLLLPSSLAVSTENNESPIFFDLEKIDISVSNNDTLIFTVSDSTKAFERNKIQSDILQLEKYLDMYPSSKTVLISLMKSGRISSLSYTETPVIFKNDHLQKASATDLTISQDGTMTYHGYFSLMTTVMRTGYPNSANEYLYTACTVGSWSKNSIFSGSNYPAAGNDFVIQTVPSTMTLVEHGCLTLYNDGNYGTEGIHSFPSAGGENYIQYEIKDDPFGLKQLKDFVLMAQYRGVSMHSTRVIHRAYTHTWKSLSITVSISGGIDTDPTISGGISITPSIVNKSWNLFSLVAFNF